MVSPFSLHKPARGIAESGPLSIYGQFKSQGDSRRETPNQIRPAPYPRKRKNLYGLVGIPVTRLFGHIYKTFFLSFQGRTDLTRGNFYGIIRVSQGTRVMKKGAFRINDLRAIGNSLIIHELPITRLL